LEIGEPVGSITCRTNPQESKAMKTVLKMLWPFKHVADYQRRYETQRELLMQRVAVCNELERQIVHLLALQKEHEKQIEELQQALDKEHSRSECFRDQIISLRKEITEFTEVTRIIGNRIAEKL
jgi:chromosome segregation ATPase